MLSMAFCMRDYFPLLAWVDILTGLDRRLKRAARTMDAFLDRVIKEYQERKVMDGRDGDDQRDFLDVLLNLQQGYETGLQMDSDSVRAIIVVS